MTTKRKTSPFKRILSAVMTVLMTVTMLPLNISSAAASSTEAASYTIMVTDGAESITGAFVTVYDQSGNQLGTVQTQEEGMVVFPADWNTEDETVTLEDGETYTYRIDARGYENAQGELSQAETEVILNSLVPIHITGQVCINDAVDSEEAVGSEDDAAASEDVSGGEDDATASEDVSGSEEDATASDNMTDSENTSTSENTSNSDDGTTEEDTVSVVGLKDATVTIISAESTGASDAQAVNMTDTVKTDEDGKFTLTVYGIGDYKIVAEKEGYQLSNVEVQDVTEEGTVLTDAIILTEDESTFAFSKDELSVTYQADGVVATDIALDQEGFVTEGSVTYRSSNEEYVKVNENGQIITVKPTLDDQSVTITAVRARDDMYQEKTANYAITVKKAPQEQLKWKNAGDMSIPWTEQYSNEVEGGSGDGSVVYSSSNEEIAMVDENGIVTAKQAGEVIITAVKAGDTYYTEKTAEYKITFETVAGAELTFADTNPEDLVIDTEAEGFSYSDCRLENPASCNIGRGDITYSIEKVVNSEGDSTEASAIATIDDDGTVTAVEDGEEGTVKVTAEWIDEENQYDKATAFYYLTIRKADNTAIYFQKSVPGSIVYAYGKQFENSIDTTEDDTRTYTYSLQVAGDGEASEIATVDETNGTVTILGCGQIIVTATENITEDSGAEAASQSYTLTILPAARTMAWKSNAQWDMAYGQEYALVATAQDNNGIPQEFEITAANGNSVADMSDVTVTSSNTNILQVNGTKLTAVGTGTVTITVSMPADNHYEAGSVSREVIVGKAQPEIVLKLDDEECTENYGNIVYDGNVHKIEAIWTGVNGDTAPDMTWNITSDDAESFEQAVDGNIATIDHIKKADITITFTVSCEENEKYEAVEKLYQLTIDKAAGKIALKDGSSLEAFIAGVTEADIQQYLTFTGNKNQGVTYQIKENENGIISKIENDGKIIFSGYTGTATIQVSKEAEDCYEQVTAEFPVTVSYADSVSDTYTIEQRPAEGEEESTGSREWYNGDVRICAAEGCKVTLDYQGNQNTVWSDCLEENPQLEGSLELEEGENAVTFYVKNAAGSVQQIQTIIKKDTVSPNGVLQLDENTDWKSSVLTIITLGMYKPDVEEPTVDITLIDVSDTSGGNEVSGIDTVQYYICYDNTQPVTEEELKQLSDGNWNDWIVDDEDRYTQSLLKDNEFVFYARVTDKAGNTLYLGSNGIIFETVAPTVEVKPVEQGTNVAGYYNDLNGVAIQVDVNDTIKETATVVSSGISEITYSIYKDGELVDIEKPVLFADTNDNPAKKDLITKWDGDGEDDPYIMVPVTAGECSRVNVEVEVTDRAGNVVTAKFPKSGEEFVIDTISPEIAVTWDEAPVTAKEKSYFNPKRTAVIYVKEDNFDGEVADGEIRIWKDGTELKEDDLDAIVSASNWDVVEDAEQIPEETGLDAEGSTIHKKIVTFDASGCYQMALENYKDRAGNAATLQENSVYQYLSDEFVVDSDEPEVTVQLDTVNFWEKLVEKITFGLWRQNKATVSVKAGDALSPVTIEYLVTTGIEELDLLGKEEKLEALKIDTGWQVLDDVVFEGSVNTQEAEVVYKANINEQFVVYIRATDYAGNEYYASSDGVITDILAPIATLAVSQNTASESLPHTEAKCTVSGQQIYTGDVAVDVHVKEQNADYASGIKKIEYWITDDEAEENRTQQGVLYSVQYDTENARIVYSSSDWTAWDGQGEPEETVVEMDAVPVYDKLRKEWNGTITIKTDEEKVYNNSCFVKVHIQVTDNAGNVRTIETVEDDPEVESICTLALDIDRTAPAIEVSYGEDTPVKKVDDRGYFDAARTATVVITERTAHFDAEAAIHGNDMADGITISAVDSMDNPVAIDLADMLKAADEDGSLWKLSLSEQDANEDTHTATIVYSTCGNYEFSIEYTDRAGLENTPVDTGDSVTPYSFTVDSGSPSATVYVNSGSAWTEVLETLTFGIWKQDKEVVSVTAGDTISPVTIEYLVTTGIEDLDLLNREDKLEALKEREDWQQAENVTFFKPEGEENAAEIYTSDINEQFVVYVRATDYAGNKYYVSSDGIITDDKAPVASLMLSDTTDSASLPRTEAACAVSGKQIYTGDVVVDVVVNEQNSEYASGIKEITYWITDDVAEENITQQGVLYSVQYDIENGQIVYASSDSTAWDDQEDSQETVVEMDAVPVYDRLCKEWNGTITIKTDEEKVYNNSCFVKVHIQVTDNAGNIRSVDTEEENPEAESTCTLAFDIDRTAPSIAVSYDNNNVINQTGDRGYFDADRTATVVITERTAHFNGEAAVDGNDMTDGITVRAVDSMDETVVIDLADMLKATDEDGSVWEQSPSEQDVNEDTHTATIVYSVDGNYEFDIEYTDIAGLSNTSVNTGESVTPYQFTVDHKAPTATVSTSLDSAWSELVEKITFGLWTPKNVQVNVSAGDVTSCPVSLEYFVTTGTEELDKLNKEAKLDALQESTRWVAMDAEFYGKEDTKDVKKLFTSKVNQQFVVYLRITDYAGNETYISSNGIITDNVSPVEESIQPQITISQPVNDIYNTNVPVKIHVIDPLVGGTYSGLKNVSYEVRNMGTVTQQGVLLEFLKTEPTQTELQQTWSDTITVDKNLNNSNEVEIWIYATDNAGNTSSDFTKIQIDITDPAIQVTYDNNAGDTSFGNAYFKDVRTATVTVTERNFDADNVSIQITNTHGVMPSISGWTTVSGAGNLDDTKHVATIVYSNDGDYTFDISCSDKVGNQNTDVDYSSSLAPKSFTIDRTVPTVNISYDNNDVQNGNYYKNARTATISITEHNFETSRVIVSMTGEDDGSQIPVPVVSGWSRNGDVNTATIVYDQDGLYTLDVTYQDMAGNTAEPIATETFYVDQTKPVVEISNIVDDSANADEGDIGFVITATDTNFGEFIPVLTAVVREGDKFVRKTLDVGEFTTIRNGKTLTVKNLDIDGIYYLTCTVVDKAGNAFNEITLYDASGNAYLKDYSENEPLVSFSVNREGSTYELKEYAMSLVDLCYVQNVTDNIVLIETNADPLRYHEITVNGKVLEEGVDYTVEYDKESEDWYHYTYIVSKELFEAEGEYNVVVSSSDKAESNAFSDIKDAMVNFVVDRTAPVISISGMETDGRYQIENQTVTLMPTDDGGALYSILVQTVDQNGKPLEILLDLMGEELENALETGNGTLTFQIAEGLYQNVQVICTDCAVNEKGDTNTYNQTFTNISVSANAVMIFWANQTLRYGTLTGGGVGIAGLILLIFLKKRKKKDGSVQKTA